MHGQLMIMQQQKRKEHPFSPSVIRDAAARARVDPRTFEAFLSLRPVRGMAHVRCHKQAAFMLEQAKTLKMDDVVRYLLFVLRRQGRAS